MSKRAAETRLFSYTPAVGGNHGTDTPQPGKGCSHTPERAEPNRKERGMADQGDGFEPITSQEDFDRMVKERLERERRKVREQFAGYDELKEKAAKWDEAQQAGKSDLEKARERINELEASAKRRDEADKARELRAKVSKATGVPAELISGADEDSMTEFAKQVAAFAKKPSAPVVTEAGRSGGSGKGADGTPRASFAKFMEENFPKK